MRKLLGKIIALPFVLTASSAFGADLSPAPAYEGPIVPLPQFSWTGFYFGGNAGADWEQGDFASNVINCSAIPHPALCGSHTIGHIFPPPVVAAGTGSNTQAGFSGGGQIGFNWQTGPLVLGAEADLDSLSGRPAIGTNGPLNPFTGHIFTLENQASADWLATVRGRIGFATDRLLVYGTGGAAFTTISFRQTYSDIQGGPLLGTPLTTFSTSSTRTGYAAGGGIEYAFANHWSVKGEYLFAGGFGSVGGSYLAVAGTHNADVHSGTVQLDIQTARVGLNYKF